MNASILCMMGLGFVDDSLQNLISGMGNVTMTGYLGTIQGWAKLIGFCIALGVGSYECWMMMLGRRGMDVMKILHIVIISICISQSSWICSAASAPGMALQNVAWTRASEMNQSVREAEQRLVEAQERYTERIDSIITRMYCEDKAEKKAAGDDKGFFDEAIDAIKGGLDTIKTQLEIKCKQMVLVAETKVAEFVSFIIRCIGEFIFQMSYYGTLLAQNCFMGILGAFCPIMFALSLAPPFRSAWSQWLSKYISLSLWGFVVYTIMFYVDFIIIYELEKDTQVYNGLVDAADTSWETIGSLGWRAMGTTCMYVVALLAGSYMIKFVSEVSSWLIPGGVSSGSGGAMAGAVTGAATSLGGTAMKSVGSGGGPVGAVAGTIGAKATENLHALGNSGGIS